MPSPPPSSDQQLLASSPRFISSAWCSEVWNIPLASSGQLYCLCSLPASCAVHRKLKQPSFRLSTTYQQLNHQFVTSSILILNPKHCTVCAWKKTLCQLKSGHVRSVTWLLQSCASLAQAGEQKCIPSQICPMRMLFVFLFMLKKTFPDGL